MHESEDQIEFQNEYLGTHYAKGSAFDDYDDYCPITEVDLYKQEDGKYLDSYTQCVLTDDDIVATPGFLVCYIGGSAEREHTLETASKALHNSLHSLFAACDLLVNYERIRTAIELSEFLKEYRSNYSDIIFVGHGSKDGITFLDRPNPIAGAELSGLLGSDKCDNPVNLISLCCHSGCATLAQSLSKAEHVTNVIAPNDKFDLRWAVHFVTGYYLHLYIAGMSFEDSVEHAARISGNQPMCIWSGGELIKECAT